MTTDEFARLLSRVATDAVLDVLPEACSLEWDIDEEIRYALAKQLRILRAEKQGRLAATAATRKRTRRRRG
jgi:hypothetical protein